MNFANHQFSALYVLHTAAATTASRGSDAAATTALEAHDRPGAAQSVGGNATKELCTGLMPLRCSTHRGQNML